MTTTPTPPEMPDEIWVASVIGNKNKGVYYADVIDKSQLTKYVRADKPDAAAARASELVEVGHQYLFIDPMIGRDVWRNRSDEWNGQRPKASRKIYILKQEADNHS